MKLSEMLFSNTKYISSGSSNQGVSNDVYQQQRLNQELGRLKPGQTLQGEVIAKNGNEVQIKLTEDLIFTARLEKNMDIESGRMVTFEVKNNGSGTLALTPLFENMGTDANVLKALDMAGLTVNGKTIAMTEAMMQGGMSVDRNSLMSMFKHVLDNPESQPASVVELAKMGLEITPENLQQLENYKNLEHQIIKDMTNVIDELPVQYENLINGGNSSEAVTLYQSVLDFINLPEADVVKGNDLVNVATNPEGVEGSVNTVVTGENEDGNVQILNNAIDILENLNDISEMTNTSENATQPDTKNVTLQDGNSALNQPLASEQVVSSVLGKEEIINLVNRLQELNIPKETLNAISEGNLSVKDTLGEISKILMELPPEMKENVSKQIFSEKGFQTLIKNALAEQWLLNPVDVQSKNKIDALYERLNSQLSKLSETISKSVPADSPLAKSVTNIQNNLDFMNQLNQMYTYVQLPLKMSEGNAHGDLYVYANKKGLASKEGNISALLHLDMEHLGPVDVYVAMQEQRVNTHFYLPDEEMLDFIEKHLYMLDERLAKKGYSMNAVMSVKGEEKTAVEEIIDNSKNMTTVSRYSFDVRA